MDIPKNTQTQYPRIGGWLVIPLISLVLNPIILIFGIWGSILPIFSADMWHNLTTPNTEMYHPLWAPLLILELIGNSVFAVFSVMLTIFFFKKKSFVPRLMVIFLLSNLVFAIGDYLFSRAIPFIADKEDIVESLSEVILSGIRSLIWVPYFMVSRRVKGTFIH